MSSSTSAVPEINQKCFQRRTATMSVRSSQKRNHRSESRERQQRKKQRREDSDESPESGSDDEMDLERELHPMGCVHAVVTETDCPTTQFTSRF